MYGISAARRPSARADSNASAMRSAPEMRQRLLEVLIPPARQTDQVEVAGAMVERPGDGVRALERGDDPFQTGGALESSQGVRVGDRAIRCAPRVPQPGVLGTGAWIVEAGGDRMGLEYLAIFGLHQRRVGAVQDTRQPGGGQG